MLSLTVLLVLGPGGSGQEYQFVQVAMVSVGQSSSELLTLNAPGQAHGPILSATSV